MQHEFEHHSARTMALTDRAAALVERCAELRQHQLRLLSRLKATLGDFRSLRSEASEMIGAPRRLSTLVVSAGSAGPAAPPSAPLDLAGYRLTRREREVADLLASGHSNAAVAQALGISEHTARHHTESVLAKLGVRSRAEAGALVRGWYGSRPRMPQLRQA